MLSISTTSWSRQHALTPSGATHVLPPQRLLLQHFCTPGHSRSWRQVISHESVSATSAGHEPKRIILDGQQTPYSCFPSTWQVNIGGQMGLPGALPQRYGRGELLICNGSPSGQIVDRNFALRQVGTSGHGGVEHFTSIGSQVSLRGQKTPRQGFRHLHLEHPVYLSICEEAIVHETLSSKEKCRAKDAALARTLSESFSFGGQRNLKRSECRTCIE